MVEEDDLWVMIFIDQSGSVIGCLFRFFDSLKIYSEIPLETFSKFEDKLKTLRFTVTEEGEKLNYNSRSLHF